MSKYVMALDSGTTSNRCILFDKAGNICAMAQKEFTQHFPHPGWVEHDAKEIFATLLGVAREAMARVGASCGDIAAIGITNQRETTVVWDKNTGEPVAPAIVWQCRRTAEMCSAIARTEMSAVITQKTGLVIDAYFSATSPARVSGQSGASCCSARSTAGSSGTSQAGPCTPRIAPTPRGRCCATSARCAGMRS